MEAKKLITVGVLMGGPSSEHVVSLATAKEVLARLDSQKYKSLPIKIARTGKWSIDGKAVDPVKALKKCDVVFNALHGTYGEDGKVQALLEHHQIPYTGSGIAASALAMDKFHSRGLFKLAGLQAPRTLCVTRGENYMAHAQFFANKVTGFPVVVKPCAQGSSVGVQIVQDVASLQSAIESALELDRRVLVEEYIKGRELTCAVLEDVNGEGTALPVTEIIPLEHHDFFNFDAKYKEGHAREVTPAALDSVIYAKAQDIARRAHDVLGCRGYSRTDMIWTPGNDDIFILELNTLPGMTPTSLLPQAARAHGMAFAELVDHLIQIALKV